MDSPIFFNSLGCKIEYIATFTLLDLKKILTNHRIYAITVIYLSSNIRIYRKVCPYNQCC